MKSRPWVATIAAYALLIVSMLAGLDWARRALLAKLDTSEARQEWEDWRSEAKRQADGEGPIQRKVPKSSEPPTLVLLRDYYGVCVVGAWLFTTLLFAVLVFVFRGVASSTVRIYSTSEERAAR
jgi:hypothetical protein